MIVFGTVHRVGDEVSAAQIFDPAIDGDDPALLAAHCLEQVDPALAEQVNEGDILGAGANFGTGEGEERAVLALQALGFAAVVCVSAAPAFVEAAELYGLPVVVSPEATALRAGETLRIDLARGAAKNTTTQTQFNFQPASAALLQAARRNAVLARMRRVVEEEGFEG